MKSSSDEEYMLATGDAAIARLRLLDEIFGPFGPSTRESLMAIGLHAGWRVADIACGIGLVTLWIAELSMAVKNGAIFAAKWSPQ